MANLDEHRNVKLKVDKLGQKICKIKVHNSDNPTTSTKIQMRCHIVKGLSFRLANLNFYGFWFYFDNLHSYCTAVAKIT